MKYVALIWSNLMRKKIRTSLTVLSILVAFLLYSLLSAISIAFNAGVSVAGADRLVVRHKTSIIQLLPESYGPRIEQIDGVDLVTHATWFGGIYQEPKNFFAQTPVEPEKFLAMYPEYHLPADQLKAWLETKSGAVVGRKTADRYGFKIGDRIPIQGTIWTKEDGSPNWEFDVVGIYDGDKGTDTTGMLFRYDYFDEARMEGGKGLVGWYTVRVKDPDRAVEIADAIEEMFANSPNETSAETELAFVQSFAKQVGDVGAILKAILSAVFFTIMLVAGNTMGQAVRERVKEIGVLKTLGFTHGQVLVMTLLESCLLAGLGGFLGLGLGWLVVSGGDPTGGALPVFYFPMDDLIRGVILVLVLGLAAGVFPALQAQRLTIATALRRD